jgi:hypothetical protein
MITATSYHVDARYRPAPGSGYDGVVRVQSSGFYGTAALLFDGRAVLTAAHLFDGRSGTAPAQVTFETRLGTQTLTSTQILVHPRHDTDANNDLALVWLSGPAPTAAERYQLYRASDEIGQTFTMVGYGRTGTGTTGATDTPTPPIRLKVSNLFDIEASTLKAHLGAGMAWTPLVGTQLLADFDDGSSARDALGQLIGQNDTGLGWAEGLIAQGDSGSPAFLDGHLAGIASYTASLSRGVIHPDIDSVQNSSFGEIAAWQRMSAHQQWIDQSLRAAYPDAPAKPEEVRTAIAEGNSGTSYVYFLLQFTGSRSDPNQIISVDYATRDGTATSGSDYVAAEGRLNLYPGETQAVIPVEIIGDTTPEANEYLYLEVFNPVGGSFAAGVTRLTAIRTILDDDNGAFA